MRVDLSRDKRTRWQLETFQGEIKGCLPPELPRRDKQKRGGVVAAGQSRVLQAVTFNNHSLPLQNPRDVKPVWPKSRRTSAELDYSLRNQSPPLISCFFFCDFSLRTMGGHLWSHSRWKVSQTAINVVIYVTCGICEWAWPIWLHWDAIYHYLQFKQANSKTNRLYLQIIFKYIFRKVALLYLQYRQHVKKGTFYDICVCAVIFVTNMHETDIKINERIYRCI